MTDEQVRQSGITHFADDATLARITELERENAELLHLLNRVIGDHNAPQDCYSTGPSTGTLADHTCPSCEALAYLAAIQKEKER